MALHVVWRPDLVFLLPSCFQHSYAPNPFLNMINDRQYQPLRASDDGVEDGDGANWDANTEIYPPGTRNFVSCILIFLLSLTANVVLVVDNAHLRSSTRHVGMTKYGG